MIVNAAHAIGAKSELDPTAKGTITIGTRVGDRCVEISIADTGTGISPDIRNKIFDPFFTTKQVGKGKGQGLSIAHTILVKKHGGTIEVDTEVGRGTTFTIRIPIDQKLT